MAEDKEPKVAAPAKPQAEEEFQEMTSLHERAIATMSYIGFLAIVPFYLKKDSKFCRFHGKQGLLIAILNLFGDIMLAAQFGIFLYMGLATLSGRWKKFPWIYNTACSLEDQLSLKTKEEEASELQLRPDEVAAETPTPETPEAK